jgi:Uncharacterised protein family (UPF0158)
MLTNIDWEELELACERNSYNVHSYLDLQTGAILVFYGESEEEEENRQNILAQKERYIKVETASSRDQYKWMEKFVSTITESALQERILIAIDGKGAFRRFKDLLVHYPGVRERWYTYRGSHLHHHINNWMVELGIKDLVTPPWGYGVEVPTDEPIEPSTVTATLSPAELLRRQSKEILDLIPAIDLPAAITFLEFLRERGSKDIAPKH